MSRYISCHNISWYHYKIDNELNYPKSECFRNMLAVTVPNNNGNFEGGNPH